MKKKVEIGKEIITSSISRYGGTSLQEIINDLKRKGVTKQEFDNHH